MQDLQQTHLVQTKGPTAISTYSTNLEEVKTPFDEFSDVFIEKTSFDLPPLRPHLGDHYINLKDPNTTWKPRPIKPKEAFLPQLREKLEKEIASGRVYKLPKGRNYSACVMFMIPNQTTLEKQGFYMTL